MSSYKKSFFSFLKMLTIVTVICGGAQFFIVERMLQPAGLYYPTWVIYLFLFIVTLLMYSCILWVNNTFTEYTGYTFMASGLIKMLIMVIFIWPVISGKADGLYVNIASIFIPYFIYLIAETLYAIKLLNHKT